MALVICSVFFTERMRRRRSIRLGIDWYLCAPLLRSHGSETLSEPRAPASGLRNT
jgi:hypothetical protein